MKKVMKC